MIILNKHIDTSGTNDRMKARLLYCLTIKHSRDAIPYSFVRAKGDSKIREFLAEEGPLLLQMAKERKAEEGALQLLTKAASYWMENATRQAAADTAAPALPAAERPAIACSLWGNGSEEAEPFEDPAPATDPWTEHKDDNGTPVWHNTVTSQSVWVKPGAAQPGAAQPAAAQAATSVSEGASPAE